MDPAEYSAYYEEETDRDLALRDWVTKVSEDASVTRGCEGIKA